MSGINDKNYFLHLCLWLGISLGISFAISIIVPFPYSLVIIIGVFFLLNFYIRKRAMRRLGLANPNMFGNSSVNYYCMNCGTKHSQLACPRCGSKMKRVGT